MRLALTSRHDEPTSEELDTLGARLGLSLLPVQPPPATAGTTAAAVVKSKIVSMLVGPVLVGALAGSAVVKAVGSDRTAAPPVAPAATSLPVSRSPETEPSPPAAPIARPEITQESSDPPRKPRRSAALDLAPSDPLPAKTSLEEPSPSEPATLAPAAVAQETEVALLQRAKALIATDPRAALALTDEHAARFPNGMLGQEAEVIALEALVGAGRTDEAAVRLARFRARFPKSAHLPHLESLIDHKNGRLPP
jgi:hypothetical protein